jgi:hypothetical protein
MVTARFKVSKVTPFGDDVETAWATEVEMTPDYADGKNKEWNDKTPSGVFRMTITNKAALEQLPQGKSLEIQLVPLN